MTATLTRPPGLLVVRRQRVGGRAALGVGLALLGAALLAVVVLMGVSLTGARSASYDEALALRLATDPLGRAWSVVTSRELDGVAYDALLRVWTSLVGASAGSARLLSVLAALAAVAMTYRLGARLVSPRTGGVAAALLAVHPLLLAAGRSAGGLAVATALLTAAVLVLLRVAESARPRDAALAVLLMVLACYCSVAAVPALLGVLAALTVRDRAAVAALRGCGLATALCLLPLLAFLLSGRAAAAGWVAAARQQDYLFTNAVDALAGGGPSWRGPAVSVALALLVATAWRAARLRLGTASASALPPLLAWAVAPIAVGLLISTVTPVLTPAVLVVSAPGLALALAAGLQRASSRGLRALALLALLVTVTPAALATAAALAPQDWDAAASVLLREARPGDRIVVRPAYDAVALERALVTRAGGDRTAAADLLDPSGRGRPVPLDRPRDLSGAPPTGRSWLVDATRPAVVVR